MLYGDRGILVELGSYCRGYRKYIAGITLKEMIGEEHVKTLSAFEHGRSSNVLLFLEYLAVAEERGEGEQFIDEMLYQLATISGEELK